MRYKCLVLDHDETVVQTEKTIGYPFFCKFLKKVRPQITLSLSDYVRDCHELGFLDMCRDRYHFTEEELTEEHDTWAQYLRSNVPSIFDGIDQIVQKQKEAGGLICVVSHSNRETILRDYRHHFSIEPDAIFGWDLPEHLRKPAPYPLQEIMKQYNITNQELFVVDDAKLAWQMANPLGVSIGYAAWGKKEFPVLDQEMRRLCDFTFDSTEELKNFLFD